MRNFTADLRTPEQKKSYSQIQQRRADAKLEILFASRVRANILRRQFGEPPILRRVK